MKYFWNNNIWTTLKLNRLSLNKTRAVMLLLSGLIFASSSPALSLTCEALFRQNNLQSAAKTSPIPFVRNLQDGASATVKDTSTGPQVYYKSPVQIVESKNSTKKQTTSYKLGSYNVYNLYTHLPHQDNPSEARIERTRREGNARVIKEMNSDLLFLIEVESIEAAERFVERYLDGTYTIFHIPGNDSRGIDIPLLVKKSLNIEVEFTSYRNLANAKKIKIFSRDLPVALIFERDASGRREEKPTLAYIGTHYKSRRADPGKEHLTTLKREEQVEETLKIAEDLIKKYGNDLPIFVAGDFNNNVHQAPEFKNFFTNNFKDTLDLSAQGPFQGPRTTHHYFGQNGYEGNQIDAVLMLDLSHKATVLRSRIINNIAPDGSNMPIPRSYAEREELPSDHNAVATEVEIEKK